MDNIMNTLERVLFCRSSVEGMKPLTVQVRGLPTVEQLNNSSPSYNHYNTPPLDDDEVPRPSPPPGVDGLLNVHITGNPAATSSGGLLAIDDNQPGTSTGLVLSTGASQYAQTTDLIDSQGRTVHHSKEVKLAPIIYVPKPQWRETVARRNELAQQQAAEHQPAAASACDWIPPEDDYCIARSRDVRLDNRPAGSRDRFTGSTSRGIQEDEEDDFNNSETAGLLATKGPGAKNKQKAKNGDTHKRPKTGADVYREQAQATGAGVYREQVQGRVVHKAKILTKLPNVDYVKQPGDSGSSSSSIEVIQESPRDKGIQEDKFFLPVGGGEGGVASPSNSHQKQGDSPASDTKPDSKSDSDSNPDSKSNSKSDSKPDGSADSSKQPSPTGSSSEKGSSGSQSFVAGISEDEVDDLQYDTADLTELTEETEQHAETSFEDREEEKREEGKSGEGGENAGETKQSPGRDSTTEEKQPQPDE